MFMPLMDILPVMPPVIRKSSFRWCEQSDYWRSGYRQYGFSRFTAEDEQGLRSWSRIWKTIAATDYQKIFASVAG
jgi:hypothetical protein